MVKLNLSIKEKYYGFLLLFIVCNLLLPVLIFSCNDRQLPELLLREDGIYESLAALFCLFASIVFLYSFFKYPKDCDYFLFSSKRNITVLIFSALLFLLFAEEISWGQRIFSIKTPDLLTEINFQNEINIHNIKTIQSRNGALSDILTKLLKAYLFYFPLFVYSFSFVKKRVMQMGIPVPSLQIVLYVVVMGLLNKFNYWFFYKNSYIKDQYHIGEAYESNIEMLLFILSLEYLFSFRERFVK